MLVADILHQMKSVLMMKWEPSAHFSQDLIINTVSSKEVWSSGKDYNAQVALGIDHSIKKLDFTNCIKR